MTKTGLRGFALGIFITCALVAIYTYVIAPSSPSPNSKGKIALTEQKVSDYLASQGKIAVDQATFNKWQNTEQNASNSSSNTDSKKTTASKGKDASSHSSATSTDSSNQKVVVKTTIHIKNGMGVWDVAKQLQQDKIIKDQQALYDYMLKNKLDKYLQLGTFTLSSDMTLQQIAHAISK